MSALKSSVIVVVVVIVWIHATKFVHAAHLLSGAREWIIGLLPEPGFRLREEFFVEFRLQFVIFLAGDGAVVHDASDLVVKRGRATQAGEESLVVVQGDFFLSHSKLCASGYFELDGTQVKACETEEQTRRECALPDPCGCGSGR